MRHSRKVGFVLSWSTVQKCGRRRALVVAAFRDVRPQLEERQLLSCDLLHDTHDVARWKACRRNFPNGSPQDSHVP